MAGHSKWATIKRKKQETDKVKGNLFAKFSRAITLAVSEQGGLVDPSQNVRLRLAMDLAKKHNMPKETIERAIEKGTGAHKEVMKRVIYEGFGPGGVALLIVVATDNANRTVAGIRSAFENAGGKLGQPGSAKYLFKTVIAPETSDLVYEPLSPFEVVDDEIMNSISELHDVLDEMDDVQQVYVNII